jgi:hypothetical protein
LFDDKLRTTNRIKQFQGYPKLPEKSRTVLIEMGKRIKSFPIRIPRKVEQLLKGITQSRMILIN